MPFAPSSFLLVVIFRSISEVPCAPSDVPCEWTDRQRSDLSLKLPHLSLRDRESGGPGGAAGVEPLRIRTGEAMRKSANEHRARTQKGNSLRATKKHLLANWFNLSIHAPQLHTPFNTLEGTGVK